MVKKLLHKLNIEIIREEGDNQYLCTCPWCGKKKLHVSRDAGLYHCKRGCDSGNAYQLAMAMEPNKTEAVKILSQCGLLFDNTSSRKLAADQSAERAQTPANATQSKSSAKVKGGLAKKKSRSAERPLIERSLLRVLTEEEIATFCEAKSLNPEAFKRLGPLGHKEKPWVLLPDRWPDNPSKAIGFMRAHIDGKSMIKLRDKEEKYPLLFGSKHGLLGLPWFMDQGSDVVLFVEAWRDMLAAINAGYVAIASTGGASAKVDPFLPAFIGKKVYIIFDADGPGQVAANKYAEKILTVASEVHMCKLPFTVENSHGRDLFDYVSEGGDIAKLLEGAEKLDEIMLLTDDQSDTIANAFELWSIEKCGVSHRHHPHDEWSICVDGHYQRVDGKTQVARYISQYTSRCRYKKGERHERVRVGGRKIADVLQQLSFLEGVYLRPSMAAPYSIDGSLDPQQVLAFDNCLVDPSNPYEIIPLSSNFYTFNYLPYKYDPDAISDKWGEFLIDITDGDRDMMILLQMWSGYLFMPTNKYQKFFLGVGDGANGKFVFFDTLGAAIGKNNVSNVPLACFNQPYKIYATYGKAANMSNENPKALESNAESVLKEYVGGDKMLWERKYRDAFSAYPTAKLMFATNILPTIRDPSDGIWRRMLYVPFDVQIPEAKQNRNLASELQQPQELAGILNWALEGRRMLMENDGFMVPKRCAERLAKYRNESNSARLFIAEHLEVDAGEGDVTIKSELYAHYQNWCKDNGYKPKGNSHFGQDIRRCFPMSKDVRKWVAMSKKTAYEGIKYQNGMETGHGDLQNTGHGQGGSMSKKSDYMF